MSDVKQQTLIDVEREAEEAGLILFTPTDSELFIDLDEGMLLNEKMFTRLSNCIGVKSSLHTISKSGNLHVYIKISKEFASPLIRVALQALLGSDPDKEFLSILQIQKGCEGCIALFETPAQAVNVRRWRCEF